jgi:enoyl-CoA hydratase/carnithine racemase
MIKTAREGAVVVATLSRPPVNALNKEMVTRLHAILDEIVADESITVLHLRSDQKIFSAGADLALMHSCFATPAGPAPRWAAAWNSRWPATYGWRQRRPSLVFLNPSLDYCQVLAARSGWRVFVVKAWPTG